MITTHNHKPRERAVEIQILEGRLRADLGLPGGAEAVVAFAHGGGSHRHSPRNLAIAQALREAGLATLMLDLIAEGEPDQHRKMFDITLQADRVRAAVAWLGREPETRGLHLGLFGAGTGAAAVLKAAARRPAEVGAIVCRGGWVDLAHSDLPFVKAPTLLIVGGLDSDILEMNRLALNLLRSPRELVVIPDATHFFPEPGTLEEVMVRATRWFVQYLTPERVGRQPA